MRKLNITDSSCFPSGFLSGANILFYVRETKPGEEFQIELFDYFTDRIVKTIKGYSPVKSAIGDYIYYILPEIIQASINNEEELEKDEPAFEESLNETDTIIDGETEGTEAQEPDINDKYLRHLYKYDFKNDSIIKLATIKMDDFYKYDVDEIVALSDSFYCYRIYNEHEYRYYYLENSVENMFYPLPDSLEIDIHEWKEQFGLVFSKDGKYAAYTERNWNELTYLVVLDLLKQERIQTPYFGSFPEIIGDKVYFISDPEFVNGKNREFRQIKNFALYSYEILTSQLKRIKNFKGELNILK
jgi:hypothetical protein